MTGRSLATFGHVGVPCSAIVSVVPEGPGSVPQSWAGMLCECERAV